MKIESERIASINNSPQYFVASLPFFFLYCYCCCYRFVSSWVLKFPLFHHTHTHMKADTRTFKQLLLLLVLFASVLCLSNSFFLGYIVAGMAVCSQNTHVLFPCVRLCLSYRLCICITVPSIFYYLMFIFIPWMPTSFK